MLHSLCNVSCEGTRHALVELVNADYPLETVRQAYQQAGLRIVADRPAPEADLRTVYDGCTSWLDCHGDRVAIPPWEFVQAHYVAHLFICEETSSVCVLPSEEAPPYPGPHHPHQRRRCPYGNHYCPCLPIL